MATPLILPSNAVGNATNQQQIYTQAYLNDPIEFLVDQKLVAQSIVQEALSGSLQSRNLNGMVYTDINSQQTMFYPIQMYSPLYDRFAFATTINTTFGFF